MADKRIIELTNERLILGDGDYTIVDSNEGTYKYKLKRIVDSIPAPDTTLSIAGRAADAKAVGDELADVKRDLSDINEDFILQMDEIPNTIQSYTFADGTVSQITHSRSDVTIRTDTFTYGTDAITEVRTSSTGTLTIVTNLTTLETTVTYAAA